MKAYRMIATGQAELEDVPEPKPNEAEVVVRPTVVGVCATDLHVLYHGGLVKESDLPLTLGHEFAGEVVEVREPQTASYPTIQQPIMQGARVAVEPLVPCYECFHCRQGRLNLCLRMSHLGISRDGCMAEYVSVPASRVVPIPDGVPDDAGALIELFACAVNFVEKAQLAPGDITVVVGAGPAGLATVQCAVAAGAAEVVAVDPIEERRDLARACGATAVVGASEEARTAVMDATNDVGADVVFDCVGSSEAVNEALRLSRRGGRVVLVGFPPGPITVESEVIVTGELRVIGAFASAWDFDRAISWTSKGKIKPELMITKQVPFDQTVQALETARNDQTQGKIQIKAT
jgi:2-desacetyl-2-hydroxyethyl bacteriochlorophyllide A dehydrogenase